MPIRNPNQGPTGIGQGLLPGEPGPSRDGNRNPTPLPASEVRTVLRELQAVMMQRMRDIANSQRQQIEAMKRREVAGAAYTTLRREFVSLPAADNDTVGCIRWVPDGLKQGETTGNGTGVLAVCVEVSSGVYEWRRLDADTLLST